MQAISLGRVTVGAAGTPVTFASLITAAQRAAIPPSGLVARIEVWPDTSSTGKVFVKCQPPGYAAPVILAALPVPVGGYPIPWSTDGDSSRNAIPYGQFSLDVATGGDGAYVTLWVN
ncbi:MAG: hypothetical protein LAQ69_20215 [Acidobacteriia bacterium]|nr:hypothetical protein [Terriglobia bacterium]